METGEEPRCEAIIMGWGYWARCALPAHETGQHLDREWLPVNKTKVQDVEE